MQLTAGPLVGFLYSSLSITLQIMVWMESLSPAKDFRFFGQAMWAEGNDLLAFQNIPTAEFEASALALIGESLARCFRAQWRCYHIISGLNGLPTVCLKGSRNDRDQLITASATAAAIRPSHRWTNAIARLFRYEQLQWESAAHAGWREALRFSGSSIYALSKKKSWHVQTQSAHPFPSLFCLFPPPCKTGISKELWCQDRAPPREVLWQVSTACTSNQKVGVTQGTFLTTITQKNSEVVQAWHTHTHKDTRWNFHSATPFMWKVFSRSGLQTSLTTMSRTVKSTPEEGEGEEKQGLGNVQTEALCLPH